MFDSKKKLMKRFVKTLAPEELALIFKLGPSFEKEPTRFLKTLTAEQLEILVKLRQRFEAFSQAERRDNH
jgi:hypothetical protein